MIGFTFSLRTISMKQLLLFFLTALTFAGCSKPGAEDSDPTPEPTRTTTTSKPTLTPVVAGKSGDWMWKNAKGTPRNPDPFSISDDPLAHKLKK